MSVNYEAAGVLALIVPCYNEEEVLISTLDTLNRLLCRLIDEGKISKSSYIVYIDDGSTDRTWKIILDARIDNNKIEGIKLSKNQGHQIALLAGLESVKDRCDYVVSIDADLQQDPTAIIEMLEKCKEGYEVVLGIRTDRESDSPIKKFTAIAYYRIMQLMGVDIETNHADYRMLSQRALAYLLSFKERNLFLRGIVKLVGLKSTKVYFKTSERIAGESKYPFKKMLSFAWEGITSFSVFPLKLITITGFVIFFLSIIASLHSFYITMFTDEAVPGWASTVLPIYMIGGIQLLSIGILGEYIGKIYTETKNRPRYFIEETIGREQQ